MAEQADIKGIPTSNASEKDIEAGLEATSNSSAQDAIALPVLQTEEARISLSAFKQLGFLDRFLAAWIFLAMAIGIILGYFEPETAPALQKGEFARVSIPIAVGLLVMMYPILCKVRYETLHQLLKLRALWVQVGFSIIVNWIIAPVLMVSAELRGVLVPITHAQRLISFGREQFSLSWAFLPDRSELREGLILVGIARCIAMVGLDLSLTLPVDGY